MSPWWLHISWSRLNSKKVPKVSCLKSVVIFREEMRIFCRSLIVNWIEWAGDDRILYITRQLTGEGWMAAGLICGQISLVKLPYPVTRWIVFDSIINGRWSMIRRGTLWIGLYGFNSLMHSSTMFISIWSMFSSSSLVRQWEVHLMLSAGVYYEGMHIG
jgi:hypothetical protein